MVGKHFRPPQLDLEVFFNDAILKKDIRDKMIGGWISLVINEPVDCGVQIEIGPVPKSPRGRGNPPIATHLPRSVHELLGRGIFLDRLS